MSILPEHGIQEHQASAPEAASTLADQIIGRRSAAPQAELHLSQP